MYEKVGRLKPDTVRDCIRIIVDGPGEIGTLSRSDAEKVLRYRDIGPVAPVGSAEFSVSGNGSVRGSGQTGLGICLTIGRGRRRRGLRRWRRDCCELVFPHYDTGILNMGVRHISITRIDEQGRVLPECWLSMSVLPGIYNSREPGSICTTNDICIRYFISCRGRKKRPLERDMMTCRLVNTIIISALNRMEKI